MFKILITVLTILAIPSMSLARLPWTTSDRYEPASDADADLQVLWLSYYDCIDKEGELMLQGLPWDRGCLRPKRAPNMVLKPFEKDPGHTEYEPPSGEITIEDRHPELNFDGMYPELTFEERYPEFESEYHVRDSECDEDPTLIYCDTN